MFLRHPRKSLLGVSVFATVLWFWNRPVPERPGLHLEMGLAAYEQGDYKSAESHFRGELRLVPRQPVASEQLALLLLKTGRNQEASIYIQSLLTRQEMFSFPSLVLFAADPDQVIDQDMLEKWRQDWPDDAWPLLGLAKIAFSQSQPQEALEMLERVIAANPNETEAHFARGRVILTTSPELLLEWNRQLPPDAEKHAGIWFVRGEWCQQSGNSQMAIRCLLEGIRIDPNDRGANLRLGQLLETTPGAPFRERAENLDTLFNTVTLAAKRGSTAESWKTVELMKSLGRFREAALWANFAMTSNIRLQLKMTQDEEFARSFREMISEAQTRRDLNPAAEVRLDGFPEWQPIDALDQSPQASAIPSTIRSRDDPTATGLKFDCFNADDPRTDGKRRQKFTGGGIGVLNVDRDEWPSGEAQSFRNPAADHNLTAIEGAFLADSRSSLILVRHSHSLQ